MELRLSELQAIQSELESVNLHITSTQSISALIDLAGKIAAWLAFSGEQMAIAKKIWRSYTAKAYDNYVFNKVARGFTITPSMANKYAEARVGEHESNYEYCERINRAATHTLDILRTCISALKAEQTAYNNNFGV